MEVGEVVEVEGARCMRRTGVGHVVGGILPVVEGQVLLHVPKPVGVCERGRERERERERWRERERMAAHLWVS